VTIGGPLPNITLRPARTTDMALLRDWRNDDQVVRFSGTAKRVSAAEHAAWLSAHLADPTTRLWVAEEDGVPVGQARIDRDGDVGTVSISVAARHRGRGVAVAILRAVIGISSAARLRALVRPGNVASLHAFERVGFHPLPDDGSGFVVLERSGESTARESPRR
jgi:RimJ/RimL family protein N-acetyltransferase